MYNTLPFIHAYGISLHISALQKEDDYGIGDISHGYRFIDFLHASDIGVWKLLPINMVTRIGRYSPYDPESVFALDFMYVDVNDLEDCDDDIAEYIQTAAPINTNTKVQYAISKRFKGNVLRLAFEKFYHLHYTKDTQRKADFIKLLNKNDYWLDDYALYRILRREFHGVAPQEWPEEIQKHDRKILQFYRQKYEKDILYEQYMQWVMHRQWMKLKAYAARNQVQLIGDVPMYIYAESADVWAHPSLFHIDKQLHPLSFGGAPPDYYAQEGQLWKMPTYNWKNHKKEHYQWWLSRLIHLSQYFDCLRLDHFRGFLNYWEVPEGKSAKEGRWKQGPGWEFLSLITREIQDKRLCSLWVEDLGMITPDVVEIRKKLGLPGYTVFKFHMKEMLLQQADTDTNAQTTIHDSETLQDLLEAMPQEDRDYIKDHLPHAYKNEHMLRWEILAFILSQEYPIVIFPIQDILGLKDRINIPVQEKGNWRYRMQESIESLQENRVLIERLKSFSNQYRRNRYYREFPVQVIPPLRKGVCRQYVRADTIYIWALSEKKQTIKGVTDLPLFVGDVTGHKEVPFTLIEKNSYGYLYRYCIKAVAKGTFYFTLMQNDDAISTFQDDLSIEVI